MMRMPVGIMRGRDAECGVRGCGVSVRCSPSSSPGASGGPTGPEEKSSMDAARARAVLGTDPDASFEDVTRARDSAKAAGREDADAAFDVLLLESLGRRTRGEVSVAEGVRFADAGPSPLTVAKRKIAPVMQSAWLPKQAKLGGEMATQSAVLYGALALWTLGLGFDGSANAGGAVTTPLAVALLGSLYFGRAKVGSSNLKRVAYLVAVAVVAGGIAGAVAENVLRVDLVPIGGFENAAAVVSLFIVGALWATVAFLE